MVDLAGARVYRELIYCSTENRGGRRMLRFPCSGSPCANTIPVPLAPSSTASQKSWVAFVPVTRASERSSRSWIFSVSGEDVYTSRSPGSLPPFLTASKKSRVAFVPEIRASGRSSCSGIFVVSREYVYTSRIPGSLPPFLTASREDVCTLRILKRKASGSKSSALGFYRRCEGIEGRRVSGTCSAMGGEGGSMLALAGTYPVKGLYFFLRKENRDILWRRVGAFAAEVSAASAAIVGSLLAFTFQSQQSAVLSLVPHFFGTPGTLALICIETAVPVVLLFYNRLHRVQEKLFDDVMRIEGVTVGRASPDELGWIADQRMVHQRYDAEHQSAARSAFAILTEPEAMSNHPLTKYLLTLPLNFFPVAGQVLFCYVNSLEAGTALHHYYYRKLKGLSSADEATVIRARKLQYQQFGVVASALTLMPGANVILVLTNAVGAALWAADLEKSTQRQL